MKTMFFMVVLSLFVLACQNTRKNNEQATGNSADSIVAGGAQPVLISDQFAFTEGPTADKEGNIYFTDQPNNKIWKYTNNGQLSVFLENCSRSNGMYFDAAGNLLSCADEHNQLIMFKANGEKTVLIHDVHDSLLNGPNDVWASANGNIYFTDPLYERPYWKRSGPRIKGEFVYLLAKDAPQPISVITDFVKPNGLVGTADGKLLYVADIGGNKTYRYAIEKNGLLSSKTLFAPQGSDGMTIDNEGNIYLTGNGISVYNSAGKKIKQIEIPQPWTANVCFGGTDKKTLFITASKAVYSLQMNVQGAR